MIENLKRYQAIILHKTYFSKVFHIGGGGWGGVGGWGGGVLGKLPGP